MTLRQARYAGFEALPQTTVTLGDQVRAEAIRRGGEWTTRAEECAALAAKWYGRRPCKGEDLHIVFGEIFRIDRG